MQSKRRSKMHATWRRRLSTLLILAGVALLLTPVAHTTYAWAQQELMSRGIFILGRPDMPALIGEPPAGEDPAPGDEPGDDPDPEPPRPSAPPVWRIDIPKLNLNAIMVYGTNPEHLAKGPGVFIQGAKPGEHGNLAIAAHRNAYGRWFRHLDKMAVGDDIYILVDETTYLYVVERVFVTEPTDWSVVAATDYDAVTLITCHPYGSTAERLIVCGRLEWIIDEDGARTPMP
jgi:sortase A